jgi:hypothetical protein
MAIAARMGAAGLPAAAALALNGDVMQGIVATGRTQAQALQIPAAICVLAEAPAGTGVILPSNGTPGDSYTIYNSGTQAINVYPPLGGIINNLAANLPAVLASTKGGVYFCIEPLKWVAVPGA